MRRMTCLLAAAVCVCIACGCTRKTQSGVAFSKFDSLQLVKNQTTEQELIAQLGQPGHVTEGAHGRKVLTWYASERARTNLPFGVGPGDQVDDRTLTVTTKAGIVTDFSERRDRH